MNNIKEVSLPVKRSNLFFVFFFFLSAIVQAQQGSTGLKTSVGSLQDMQEMFAKIKQVSPSSFVTGSALPEVQASSEAVVFKTTIALRKPVSHVFVVTTKFFRHSPTIDRYVEVVQGKDPDDRVHMRMVLDNQGQAFKQVLLDVKGTPVQVYDRPGDVFAYMQSAGSDDQIDLKEWIYARQPNCPQGTCLRWLMKGEDFNRRLVFGDNQRGDIEIQRQMMLTGAAPMDYQKQRHIINAAKQALKAQNIHLAGEDVIGKAEPVYYWTKEGVPKIGKMSVTDEQILEVIINEGPQAYPLLIDPTFVLQKRRMLPSRCFKLL